MLRTMFGSGPGRRDALLQSHEAILVIGLSAAVFVYHRFMRDKTLEDLARMCPWWIQSLLIAVLLFLFVWSSRGGGGRAFI